MTALPAADLADLDVERDAAAPVEDSRLRGGDVIGWFELENRTIAVLHRPGDPYGDVRLAYQDEPEIELGRVVALDQAHPKLATAIAVWTPVKRELVLAQVREVWRWWEIEVLR